MVKKLLDGTFYEQEMQKTNPEGFRIEKVKLNEKERSYMSNGKVMIIHLLVGLI